MSHGDLWTLWPVLVSLLVSSRYGILLVGVFYCLRQSLLTCSYTVYTVNWKRLLRSNPLPFLGVDTLNQKIQRLLTTHRAS